MDQSNFFSNTQKAFSTKSLKQLLYIDSIQDTSFMKSKQYFLHYYAKALDVYTCEYKPSEDNDDGCINVISCTKMNEIWNNFEPVEYLDGNGNKCKFNLHTWFNKRNDNTYDIIADPRKSRFYTSEKTGQKFVNICNGSFINKESHMNRSH